MPEPLTLAWVLCPEKGVRTQGVPGTGKEPWMAAGWGGRSGHQASHLPAGPLGSAQVAPAAPAGVGGQGWPGPWGTGAVLPEVTFDKESKGHGNNSSLSLRETWQDGAGAARGWRPLPAAQDKQGGMKFPRSQGRAWSASSPAPWG